MQRPFLIGVIIVLLLISACSTAEPASPASEVAVATAVPATLTPAPTKTPQPTETPIQTETATMAVTETATVEPTVIPPTATPEPTAEVAPYSPIERLAEAANITIVNAPGAPENENPVPIWFGDQPIPWGIEVTDMEEFSRLIFSEWVDNVIIPVLRESNWTHEEFQPYRDLFASLEDKSEASVREAIVNRIQEEGFVRLPWLEWDGWYPGVTELPRYGPPVRPTVVRANLNFTIEVLHADRWESSFADTYSPADMGLEAFPENLLWWSAGSALMFDGTKYQILLKGHAAAAATAAKPNFIWVFDCLSWETRRAILGNDPTVMSPEANAKFSDAWSWDEQGLRWPLATVKFEQ